VTTRQQLDTALATADQITVEGDDVLLSYAVSKASDIEVSVPPAPAPARSLDEFEALLKQPFGPKSSATIPSKRRGIGVRTLVAIMILCGVIAGYAASEIWDVISAPPPVALPSPSAPAQPSSGAPLTSIISSAGWPLVALAAIVALFLIARQAIFSGSDVTITWKITQHAQGRVVITKVRERAPKAAA